MEIKHIYTHCPENTSGRTDPENDNCGFCSWFYLHTMKSGKYRFNCILAYEDYKKIKEYKKDFEELVLGI